MILKGRKIDFILGLEEKDSATKSHLARLKRFVKYLHNLELASKVPPAERVCDKDAWR